LALLIGSVFALSACGPPASGITSSAPEAVKSAASGSTGGGANQFTPAQISPGSPAGANINLQAQPDGVR
jgi:hypothetical protein